jgi:hypothetical protein
MYLIENEVMRQELKIQSIQNKTDEYRKSWINHLAVGHKQSTNRNDAETKAALGN